MEQGPTRRAVLTAAAALMLTPARAQDTPVLRAGPGVTQGPPLRIRRGEELKLRLVNETAAAVAPHWYGLRLPNAVSRTTVAPGASVDYRFTPPDAGTFWYRIPGSLYGPLIVEESAPVDVDRDVTVLLDGATAPDIPFGSNERVRVRLINAGAHLVTVTIERHPARVMAIDGQPAAPFLARAGRITLAPGNRVDLFVDAALDAATRHGAPQPLRANPLPERIEFRGALRAAIDLSRPGDPTAKPLFSAKRGRTVMLALSSGATAAVLHVHGHHVRLLDALDDGWKPFWLDTILVMPQAVTRIAFVADNPGKWLLESRAIGAQPQAAGAFEVT